MPVDPSAHIARTAVVDPSAEIGPGTHIGEFCVIESDVSVGANCRLEAYVNVKRWTRLGNGNEVSATTVLGTDPLDKSFSGARSYLVIGNNNKIREHYTISRGTEPESETRIGDGNFIMTAGHIAHNCVIGDNAVIASTALIAGYARIGDGAFISGGVVVHQYARVGRLAMVGGNSRVPKDLVPFFMYLGFDARPRGLNLVGLRRAGFSAVDIAAIKSAYRLLFRSGLRLEDAMYRIETDLDSPHAREIVEFVRHSKRGIARERTGDDNLSE
jgi:UDP-N-acetylglucosamine acyltransferase